MSEVEIDFEVNGEVRRGPAGMTIRELLEGLDLGDRRVAVEINRVVARKDEFDTTAVRAGDRIEIVSFVGGG